MKNKGKFILGVIVGVLLSSAISVFAYTAKLEAYYNNIKIKLNDTYIDTGADEPFTINGRTYVPARYVAEAMGGQVGWDAENSTVNITTPFYHVGVLNCYRDQVLLEPTENKTDYLLMLDALAEYLTNNSLSDAKYIEMQNHPVALQALNNTLMTMSFPHPTFDAAFSEFWTKENAEQYKDIFNKLHEHFYIEFDTTQNCYCIQYIK